MSSASFFRLLFGENISEKNQLILWRFKADGGITSTFHITGESAAAEAAKADDTEAVYFGNTLRDGQHTNKSGVRLITHLWADFDYKNFVSEEEAQRVLEGFELEPSLVVSTGGGLHIYWKLATPIEATPQNMVYVESIMERLYFRLGGLDHVQNMTRILRVPGSHNAKYKPPRPVRLVQQSEVAYALDAFDSVLPALPTRPSHATEDDGRLYGTPTEKEIADLLSVLPSDGWEYSDYNAILMAVHSVFPDEVGVRLIQAWSPALDKRTGEDITAGKFASYQGQGISAGTLYHLAKEHGWMPRKTPRLIVKGKETPAMKQHTSIGTRLDTVTPEHVSWLWPGYIPYGKLTVVDGDPGLGKSAMTMDLAARLSVGQPFPDGTPTEAAGVVLLTAEDGLADTIVPRLQVAGANLSRILSLTTLPAGGDTERLTTLPDDIPMLEQAIEEVGAKLVIVDPLMAFLGGDVNSYRDQDIRRALTPLAKMAERTGAAVVLVRHLNKSTGGQALYRGGGSIGIIGAVRSGLLVAKDPDDPQRRVLASTKSNLGQPPTAWAYRLEGTENGAPRVVWLGESRHGAEALLAPPSGEEDRTAKDDAKDFLHAALSGGCAEAAKVTQEAGALGIAGKTLTRAKQALGVRSSRSGFGPGSQVRWCLPTATTEGQEAA